MKIYKYGYEEGYPDSDKTMEAQGLIANELFLWYPHRRPERTKTCERDKEVQLLPI